ncbi:MAG: hypothetical protein ACM3ME_04300 [Chloroflexota bacterium]|nr:hypothetical protein [Lentimicrobium sp.]
MGIYAYAKEKKIKNLMIKLLSVLSIVAVFLFAGFTSNIKPVKSEKQSDKKTEANSNQETIRGNSIDYLKLLLPDVLLMDNQASKITYRKDTNGVYKMVIEEGC